MRRTSTVLGGIGILIVVAGLTGTPAYAATGIVQTREVDDTGHLFGLQEHVEINSHDCFVPPDFPAETSLIVSNVTDEPITVSEGPCSGGTVVALSGDTTIGPGGSWAFHGHIEWHVEM